MAHKAHYVFLPSRLAIVAALFVFFGAHGTAQVMNQHPPAITGAPEPQHTQEEDAWERQQRKDLAKKFNLQRQQEIKKDTEKLLELATELKQSVEKTNEDTLSLDVIKKADQIEKLAKTVKKNERAVKL